MTTRVAAVLAQVLQRAKALAPCGDGDLLRRYAETGDQAAFATIVSRHAAMVLGVCRRFLPSREDAEDACQAVFLILCRKAKSLPWRASVANWLYSTARKVARNARLSSSRRARRERAAAVPESVAPTDLMTCQELLAVLDEELDRLPPRYREPLVVCYLEGLTRDEAATLLGVPQATLKSQLERGRKKLADALTARGLALGALLLATAAAAPSAKASSARLFESILAAAGGAPSPAVAALAREVAVQGLTKKARLALAVLAGVVVVGVGLGLAPTDAVSQPAPARDDRPADGKAARVDRFGDPLPDGAVARLGTLGFRAPNLIGIGFRKTGEVVGFGEDLALHVWPADGSPKATTTLLTGKKQYGWRRALSADARFAAGFLDNEQKLVVWDVSGDKPAEYLSREVKDVYQLAFSANGAWLAVNDTGRDQKENLLLCHLPTKEWSAFALGGSGFGSLSFTADGKGLAVATDRDVVVIDTAQKKELRRVTIPRERPTFAALSPDGKTLAFLPMKWLLGPDQVVRLFSLDTGREVKAFTLSTGSARSARWVSFSPDGKSLWAGSPRGLSEWDPAAGKLVRQVAGPADQPAAFSPEGHRIAAHSESTVLLWDIKQGKTIRPDLLEGGHTAAIMSVTPSPDGRVIATGDIAGEIRLWDAGAGRPLGRVASSWGRGPRVAFLPDSRSFLAVADDYATPVLFDAANGKELRRFAVPEDVAKSETTGELRLSGDGRTLTTVATPITSGQKSYAVRWDVRTGKVTGRTETAQDEREMMFGTSYSPDGQWEVKLGAVGRVGEKEPIHVAPANETAMLRAQFTADSRLVSVPRAPRGSSAEDRDRGSLVLYDLLARASLGELPTGRPLRHALSPGGREVAVFTREELALWDLPSGKKVWGVPSEHGNVIRDGAIAFTPDGCRLITGHDCTALVWDLGKVRRGGDKGPAKLSADELAKLWDALAGGDAVKAYRAESELADRPAEAVSLLRNRLKPAKAAEVETVRPLLAKLDALEFEEREAASKALKDLGEAAVPALRQALKRGLSAEQKKRVEELLAAADASAVLSGDLLRQVRAVSVLERAATPAARELLAELASGNPEARLTKEAKAASARVNRIPQD
jgi:RNA polymerase sigma factor (sigma-70 family)